jgi:4-hydroxy-tetrahydrodipicolinate reductase
MILLILGRGKTGSLVAEVAAERKHEIRVIGAKENVSCTALTPETLRGIDTVIDFTAPHCVLAHIEACVRGGKNMVVGTTGWYGQIDRVRELVVARAAAAALSHDYSGQIFERHHAQKKDAPSGTAIALQQVIREASGLRSNKRDDLEITSFREGDVVGLHEVVLESSADRIYLCHDAKSRRGFAEGAVRAAEWLASKKGFYDFKDVWRQL